MTGPGVKPEVDAMIEDLQLVDKANQKSSALSGGQKRKLRCVYTCGNVIECKWRRYCMFADIMYCIWVMLYLVFP